ncbi:MAG: hypothetical protein A2Y62_08090 [Candidatus Fischerbacteria bacterium RBG_13_37_8]|uniref:Uncharacterized protein n=1 Tax=Candidatus Fischerbacteria bacterium RBG_13_37_8 TaxID=1817863 RepID=A0A1F5VW93_9BACT|nr:MAG: hypothetical protein A2Y62_08090 [Candidatus Fischerbacteria bacterium RBG_13_37_8]
MQGVYAGHDTGDDACETDLPAKLGDSDAAQGVPCNAHPGVAASPFVEPAPLEEPGQLRERPPVRNCLPARRPEVVVDKRLEPIRQALYVLVPGN